MGVPITDAPSIERLIGLARESPPDDVLGIIWRYAFEEGKEMGQLEGIEVGRDREKRAWGAAGHGKTCITVPRPPRKLRDCGVQHSNQSNQDTNPRLHHIQPKTPTCETSSQTSLITTNSISTQTVYLTATMSSQTAPDEITPISESVISVSQSLNWADEANLLPILPQTTVPRDFSGLRSGCTKPFGTIQRRNMRQHYRSHRPFIPFHESTKLKGVRKLMLKRSFFVDGISKDRQLTYFIYSSSA